METFCTLCSSAHAATHDDDGVLFGDPPLRDRVAVPARDLLDALIPIDVEKRIREEWMGEERPA